MPAPKARRTTRWLQLQTLMTGIVRAHAELLETSLPKTSSARSMPERPVGKRGPPKTIAQHRRRVGTGEIRGLSGRSSSSTRCPLRTSRGTGAMMAHRQWACSRGRAQLIAHPRARMKYRLRPPVALHCAARELPAPRALTLSHGKATKPSVRLAERCCVSPPFQAPRQPRAADTAGQRGVTSRPAAKRLAHTSRGQRVQSRVRHAQLQHLPSAVRSVVAQLGCMRAV